MLPIHSPVSGDATDEAIEIIMLRNGFKKKAQPDGTEALNPYVFAAARDLLDHVHHVNLVCSGAFAFSQVLPQGVEEVEDEKMTLEVLKSKYPAAHFLTIDKLNGKFPSAETLTLVEGLYAPRLKLAYDFSCGKAVRVRAAQGRLVDVFEPADLMTRWNALLSLTLIGSNLFTEHELVEAGILSAKVPV